MAGYNDTRNLIIEALMGRQAGTEIQPEKHQAYALNMLDYVRSVELVSSSTLVGLAEESTVPVQPDQGKVCYIAGVGQDRTVTFSNFIDDEGNPISITTGEMEGVFVILLWNMEHWVSYTFNTNIISSAESANFYYNYNIRKTYASVAAMNADSVNPIGTDGRLIKIGELVTVVNSTTPAENGYYSYEGSENGWLLQSGFSFEIVQTTGTDINKTMSQKAVTDELALKIDKTSVKQVTGESIVDVMSQKAVTDEIAQLEEKITIFGLANKTTENSTEFFDITDLNGKPFNNVSLTKGTHLVVRMMDATTGTCAIRIGESSRDIMFNKTYPNIYNSWKPGDIVDIFIDDHIIEIAPDAIRANVTLNSRVSLQELGNNNDYGVSQKVVSSIAGFFDVHSTQVSKTPFESRNDARNAVPNSVRKQGLIILYYYSESEVFWQNSQLIIERFIGSPYIELFSNNSYWESMNGGLSDYSYLGDITDTIQPLGENYICEWNPINGDNLPSVKRLNTVEGTRCYYTATVKRGVTTFSNFNGKNYTCDKDIDFILLRKNPQYWYVEPLFPGLGDTITSIGNLVERKVEKSINPLKNCFRLKDTIVGKHIISFSSGNGGIVDEENTRIIIIPLYGWGDDNYCNISGFGKRKYSTTIIFLDENKQPVDNGGSYGIDENGTYKSIGLGSMKLFGLHYIAIELYRGLDFNNRNPLYGYVWSDEEKKQGYPNWLNDVCVNFSTDNSTVLPEKEDGCGEFYRYDKTYCFAKASEDLAKHVIKRGTSSKMFNFAFATDSHIDANYASKQNVIDMVDFVNQSNISPFIDCIINDGDTTTPGYLTSYDNSIKKYIEYYNIVSKCSVDYIQVIGNHDKHREHDVNIEEAFSDSTIVDMLKQYTKHISDNIYETVDYADNEIRIIKLDAFDYPNEANSEGTVKYPLDLYDPYISQSQMEWFINQLASTPEGYSIIVVSHSYMQSILINYITMMMKALKEKSTGTMTVTYDYAHEMPTNEYSVNYDFTTAYTCYPAICLCGHSHADGYDKKNGIHVLNTGCQALINVMKPWRIQNTPTQNLFNLMTIDSISHRIYLTRYGILEEPDFIKSVEPSFDISGFLTY